jgi:hypothetical protein
MLGDGKGNYTGTIPASVTMSLTPAADYLIGVTSVLSGATIDYRQQKFTAQIRGFDE